MENLFTVRLRKKIRKKLIKSKKGNLIPLSEMKKVGIIYNLEEEGVSEGVLYLVGEFSSRGIEMYCLGLDKKNNSKLEDFPKITKENFRWNGLPRGEAFKDFVSRDYDVIIDLCSVQRPVAVDYILLMSKANMRLGLHGDNIFDIDFPVGNLKISITEQLREVVKYLSVINFK